VSRTLAISCRLLLVVGLASWGCSSTEKIHLTESGAPDFQQLAIVYDVNSLGGLARAEAPLGVEPAGLVEPSQPAGPPTRLHLEVQYPYPGVHPDFVHVTLRSLPPGVNPNDLGIRESPPPGIRGFSNANSRGGGLLSITVGPPAPATPKPGEECLVIDMPKTELSPLFVDLANDGFFGAADVKDGASHLAVFYNKGRVEKTWVKEPRLEQLVTLLKRHGSPTVYQPLRGPLPGYYTARTGKM
jgi:hypothetical protein